MTEHDYDNLLMQLRFCHTPGSCHHCTIDVAKCHRKISKLSLEVQAAVAFEALRSENAQLKTQIPQWVSVDERLPEQKGSEARGTYLVHLASGCIKTLFYEYPFKDINRLFPEGWHQTGSPVTHWMSLPEPPKGVE